MIYILAFQFNNRKEYLCSYIYIYTIAEEISTFILTNYGERKAKELYKTIHLVNRVTDKSKGQVNRVILYNIQKEYKARSLTTRPLLFA